MKRTLMTSVALSAMLVGASVTGPALTSGFLAPAHAQDAEPAPEGTQDALAEEMEDAPADDAAPEDDTTTEEVPLDSGDAAEEPADEPMGDEPMTDEPATDEPMTDEPATDEPMTDEPMDEETEAPAEEPATDMAAEEEPAEMFYTQQEEGEISANTYVGQSLYNMADESIGSISDLIFTVDGGVTAAIVGVGGFLGIGEKNVAVNFDMIEIQEQPDSADVRLVIDATQETLEAAPEYETRDDQIAEEQANQPAMAPGTTPAAPGGAMTPAPAPAPAPAQ